MAEQKISSNQNTALHLAPVTAVADTLRPLLPEAQSATNVSEAVKWDGFDFNIEASEQDEDRALTDAAGAATRGYENFGGNVSLYKPQASDATSIYRTARNIVGKSHTELVAFQRDGLPASTPFAAGQVVNVFHVITDARSEQRGDKNRYYTVNLKSKGHVGINRILPSSVPTAVAITGSAAVAAGEAVQLKAVYEGNDITVGAEWRSSDEAVATVTKHGIVIGVSAGTADITATYPGSAASTAHEVEVS